LGIVLSAWEMSGKPSFDPCTNGIPKTKDKIKEKNSGDWLEKGSITHPYTTSGNCFYLKIFFTLI